MDKDFASCFPIWNKLTQTQKDRLLSVSDLHYIKGGTILHDGSPDCMGMLLIRNGQLRAYILSDEGREVSIYRLFERDLCLFSASCMLNSIQFEIIIQTEKDSEIWVIPVDTYKEIMSESAAVANFTNEIMASRFSDVMWLIEQIMWKSLDKRLASFLLEESTIEDSLQLRITHETIANHLGTHREVITRMLRYFQNEGMVKLSRGSVELVNITKLNILQN